MFVMGDLWQEHRRFTMRHLRDLGFGKTSIEDQMTEELNDLIKDIENDSKSAPNKVVSLKNVFQVSVQNILWAIIAGIHYYTWCVYLLTITLHVSTGERFQRNDPKFEQLLTANEKLFRAGDPVRGNIPVPHFFVKHFRFIRDFIGLKIEFITPIQQFVQVLKSVHLSC